VEFLRQLLASRFGITARVLSPKGKPHQQFLRISPDSWPALQACIAGAAPGGMEYKHIELKDSKKK
jgi:hypothetical protein